MIQYKQTDEIKKMAAAGHIVANVLEAIQEMVKPGITTGALNKRAIELIEKAGATPSFLGYGQPPFPGAICASVDCEVVHGIPSDERYLAEGSILSVDVGAYLDGYHGDAARTFFVGQVEPQIKKLVEVTEQCFWKAFELAVSGNRLGDLSSAIQTHAESHGYSIVRELTGHGIGRHLHEGPDLPNYGKAGRGLRIQPGLVIAMEPMVNLGSRQISIESDGWTIVTVDRKPSAHYENTFAVTEDGPVILTR